MKTSLTPMLLCAALACALVPVLAAQTTAASPEQANAGFRTLIKSASTRSLGTTEGRLNTARAVFSDPNKPGTLKINDAFSHVEIQGVAGGEVWVVTPLALANSRGTDGEGFRQLDASSVTTLELVEKDNVISLKVSEGDDRMTFKHDFKIQVPRNTNIIIETDSSLYDRHVIIANTDGDVNIYTETGDIVLKNTTGIITANTAFGSIIAELGKSPERNITLASMRGDIDLALPSSATANLRMSARLGGVRTSFPEAALKAVTEPGSTFSWSNPKFEAKNEASLARVREEMAKRRQSLEGNATTPDATSSGGKAPTESERQRIDAIREEISKRRQAIKKGESTPESAASVSRGKVITGNLNGGGADISLTTGSGVITLKEAK